MVSSTNKTKSTGSKSSKSKLKTRIKAADKLFNANTTGLMRKLGESTTTSTQLNKIGSKLFGDLWQGANSQDQVQLPKNRYSYQIVNTDTSEGAGIHWVGLFTTPDMVYVYDSFGRDTEKILPLLSKQLKKQKIMYKESLQDAEQFGKESAICGQLSMAWLMLVAQDGIDTALLI